LLRVQEKLVGGKASSKKREALRNSVMGAREHWVEEYDYQIDFLMPTASWTKPPKGVEGHSYL